MRPQVASFTVDVLLAFRIAAPCVSFSNLGYQVSDQTVSSILMAHGIEPAPERKGQTI
jgi:hypothetical protein